MNRIVPLALIAIASPWLLPGCAGSKRLEAEVAAKQTAIDRLEARNRGLESENGALKTRVGELEKSMIEMKARAADLDRELERVRKELEKAAPKGRKGNLEGAYREALRNYMDRRYEEAISSFEELLAAGIPDPLNDNCHYWIGESYFGLGRYAEALAQFDEVLEFEWSNKKDDAQVMIARCHARMGDAERARAEYRRLLELYPASPYLDLARRRVGAM